MANKFQGPPAATEKFSWPYFGVVSDFHVCASKYATAMTTEASVDQKFGGLPHGMLLGCVDLYWQENIFWFGKPRFRR